MRFTQLSSLNPKSRSMPASVVSDFERWSKLSHPGGWRGEERPSRPTSRPIDVMVIAQSFMDGPESFWDLRCPILQCGCFQKIGGRGCCDECARNATSVEQLRERRCRLTCPYFVFSTEHPRGHFRQERAGLIERSAGRQDRARPASSADCARFSATQRNLVDQTSALIRSGSQLNDESVAMGPGRVKTLRSITAPGILRLVVTLRAKICKNSSSA
jgi:hypothetical protein